MRLLWNCFDNQLCKGKRAEPSREASQTDYAQKTHPDWFILNKSCGGQMVINTYKNR